MSNHMLETIMGALVLVVAAFFLQFAYQSSGLKSVEGYAITANFTNITGIGLGGDVRIGGIKVGVVEKLTLNEETFSAVASLRINDAIKLPDDSSAAVQSAGLLGEKFIAIEPGGSEDILKEGGAITFTQASVSLEEMIGKFMFSGGGVDDGKDDKTSSEDDELMPSLGLE
jgi:phospholipid/cholesterol/gamma-HCH transport system substrate-binding protein